MKQTNLTILENTRLADGIYRLRLAGDTHHIDEEEEYEQNGQIMIRLFHFSQL